MGIIRKLALPKILSPDKERKSSFSFLFRSLNRKIDFVEDTIARIKKENRVFLSFISRLIVFLPQQEL